MFKINKIRHYPNDNKNFFNYLIVKTNKLKLKINIIFTIYNYYSGICLEEPQE